MRTFSLSLYRHVPAIVVRAPRTVYTPLCKIHTAAVHAHTTRKSNKRQQIFRMSVIEYLLVYARCSPKGKTRRNRITRLCKIVDDKRWRPMQSNLLLCICCITNISKLSFFLYLCLSVSSRMWVWMWMLCVGVGCLYLSVYERLESVYTFI